MRKYIVFSVLVLLCMSSLVRAEAELNLWTWEGYAPDELVKLFEEETGMTVNITYYSNNNELISKLRAAKGRGVDLVQPSVTLIPQAMDYDLYQPLDLEKIPNLKNVYPSVMKASKTLGGEIDGETYGIPFSWGTSGLMYNTERVSEAIDSYGALFDDNYAGKVTYRATLHTFISAGLYLGLGNRMRDIYKDEETARPILDEILAFLIEKKGLVKTYWTSRQENIDLFVQEAAYIGQGWDGTGWLLAQEGYPVKFVAPKEGALTWFDTFALPKGAENLDAAYAWMNFMLRDEIAGKFSDLSGFTSAIQKSVDYISPERTKLVKETFPKEPVENLWLYGIERTWWTNMMNEYIEKLKLAE
ncbi:spermidine/putrescine ABC transporter substrate-binding protein [candidate division KSB3 bacterium]|uniref:Spermidine/putrescine ABC transporter substrate-binding protein n=1 Tax=candidate division KSB3 bacterium TaxID=2044937 RepID=A0A2G6E3A0_9BACT|nr:MAG: spermidine/putrescine ABC transporter substrate-binding protein [candidate division KSB3 bacterium]PIE28904.1 MAG: spermidine/putrescine ABC transporter substrate-binding protein [candidate division KSB3 bacterium]